MNEDLQVSDYFATILATLIAFEDGSSEADIVTAQSLFAEAYNFPVEEARRQIHEASMRLAPNSGEVRRAILQDAGAVISEYLEVGLRQVLFLILLEVSSVHGPSEKKQQILSWLHGLWEIPSDIGDIEKYGESKSNIVMTGEERLCELLATAVEGAHIRSSCTKFGTSIPGAKRQELEEVFWSTLDSIFKLATLDSNGVPVAADAPSYCGAVKVVCQEREEQSSDPEASTFFQLRCDFSILFPDEPLPYTPTEGTEDFESHANGLVEKKRLELGPQWREKMLAPIERGSKASEVESARQPSTTPSQVKSSGCALFFVVGIGFSSFFLL